MQQSRKMLLIISLLATIALSACSREEKLTAQGYIEGRYTYVATSVSGVLTALSVERGARVKQGQALFTLEAQPESDTYQSAIQTLAQAKSARDAIAANLKYARLTEQRYQILVAKKAIDQSQLDEAKSNSDALAAQLHESEAKIAEQQALLSKSSWTLQQKQITAPIDGFVFDTYYRLGEYTLANQPILSLLAPKDVKAIFYISQTDLAAIRLGNPVSVFCDRCQKHIVGHISYISPSAEYTPPVIYSNETNEKLIYRIEAEFAPADAVLLHPGEPISVTYQRMPA